MSGRPRQCACQTSHPAPVVCEREGISCFGYYMNSLKPYSLGVGGQPQNCIAYPGRHNEGNNVGFCDGHAKWIGMSTLLDRDWDGWTAQPSGHP
ncbi:MAG: H-X9-DG-CTERM domain-containing protein [Armatimonadota bacterium]